MASSTSAKNPRPQTTPNSVEPLKEYDRYLGTVRLNILAVSGLALRMDDFEPWYRQEHRRVLATCLAFAGDLDAASEATDEAFTRAFERWDRVSLMARPGGWVQMVALNCLRRNLRRRRFERLVVHGARTPLVDELPDADLWKLVQALPLRQREAVVLRYVHDLPEDSIAEHMGITRSTVAATLRAARSRLDRLLNNPSKEQEATHG